MNSAVFQGLNRLKEVYFNFNTCMSIDFIEPDPNYIRTLQNLFQKFCGFDEPLEVFCAKIDFLKAEAQTDMVKTCYMDNNTSIDAKGAIVGTTSDRTIGGLDFSRNKKIVFLPENVVQKFQYLVNYNASDCSVKEISKKNFELLNKLSSLDLHGNQIERIPRDTLDDLTDLKVLYLSKKNQI